MATLKETIQAAQAGKLSASDQEKLKQAILSGKMDDIAASEGVNLLSYKAKFGAPVSAGMKVGEDVVKEPIVSAGTKVEMPTVVTGKEEFKNLPVGQQEGLKEESKGFIGRAVGGFMEEGKQAIDRFAESKEARESGDVGNFAANMEHLGNTINLVVGPFRAAFEKAVVEPTIEGIMQVADKAGIEVRPEVKEAIAPVAESIKRFYDGLDDDTKRQLGIAGDSVNNLLALFGAGAVAKTATKRTAQEISENALLKLESVIDETFDKAVRPSIPSTKAAGGIDAYKVKARDTVATIVENKGSLRLADEFGEIIEGKLPESIKEFSDAIHQTKQAVYGKYSASSKEAGEAGAEISLLNTVDELVKVADNSVLADLKPEVINYIKKRIPALKLRKVYSPTEAEEALKLLNESLSAYYRNPTPESYSKAAVDSMIANNLRKQMDDVINKATGSEYQALKNQYAALKAMEKDVSQRAIVNARKSQIGLIDFSDIFSAGDVISGIVSAQPALMAKGVSQNLLKNIFKKITDPDRAIKGMFKQADEVLSKELLPEVVNQTKG